MKVAEVTELAIFDAEGVLIDSDQNPSAALSTPVHRTLAGRRSRPFTVEEHKPRSCDAYLSNRPLPSPSGRRRSREDRDRGVRSVCHRERGGEQALLRLAGSRGPNQVRPPVRLRGRSRTGAWTFRCRRCIRRCLPARTDRRPGRLYRLRTRRNQYPVTGGGPVDLAALGADYEGAVRGPVAQVVPRSARARLVDGVLVDGHRRLGAAECGPR